MSQQEIPTRVKEDFADYFRTELHKHYLHDPSGLTMLIEISKNVNRRFSEYENDPIYKVGQMIGFRNEFENNLEENLQWVQPLLLNYLEAHSIGSKYYSFFRKMAVELVLELVEEKI
jgi:hypothetical protein